MVFHIQQLIVIYGDTAVAWLNRSIDHIAHSFRLMQLQGRNHWEDEGAGPPKIWMDHPNFFHEECDYRYVTHCSARNWVYHPYFVLYNNLDQGIGPPTLKTWLHPCAVKSIVVSTCKLNQPWAVSYIMFFRDLWWSWSNLSVHYYYYCYVSLFVLNKPIL